MTSSRPASDGSMNAARKESSAVLMPCSVTSTGRPSARGRSGTPRPATAARSPEPIWLRGTPSGGGTAPGAVVVDPLVVLHADEVVVPRPARASVGRPRRACRHEPCVVTDHDVVDDRQAQPDRQVRTAGLDSGRAAATWPAARPSPIASISSGSMTFDEPVPVDPGRLARRSQRRALQVADEVRQVEPGEQSGQVRLVHGDGEGDPVAEGRHHPVAVPGEQRRRLRIEPAAALRRTSAGR